MSLEGDEGGWVVIGGRSGTHLGRVEDLRVQLGRGNGLPLVPGGQGSVLDLVPWGSRGGRYRGARPSPLRTSGPSVCLTNQEKHKWKMKLDI